LQPTVVHVMRVFKAKYLPNESFGQLHATSTTCCISACNIADCFSTEFAARRATYSFSAVLATDSTSDASSAVVAAGRAADDSYTTTGHKSIYGGWKNRWRECYHAI